MAKARLASALVIPPPAATEIDGLRRACHDSMLGRVDAHITLVEPINVREEALDDVGAVMRAAAASVAGPLTFTVGPARSFHPVSPVLYLAVEGDLAELTALRAATRKGPFAREATLPFVPHVTIGTDLSEERLEAGVEALADFSLTVTLGHMQVLREQRDADDVRRWRPIADAALGGVAVSGRGGIELEVTESAGAACVLTARRGGRVVGELRAWVDADEALLASLTVDDPERGVGVGRRLLARFEEVAHARGLARMVAPAAGDVADFLRARGWRDEGGAMVREP